MHLTYLNALYRGLYQHINEQGVNRTNHTMDMPNVAPPLESAMKYAKLAHMLRKRTHA